MLVSVVVVVLVVSVAAVVVVSVAVAITYLPCTERNNTNQSNDKLRSSFRAPL